MKRHRLQYRRRPDPNKRRRAAVVRKGCVRRVDSVGYFGQRRIVVYRKSDQLTLAIHRAPIARWDALACSPCGDMFSRDRMYPCGHMIEEPAM
jgi:hypothetical protein